ncbi:hypothetical protein A1O7_05735 [Cladophialophora yegresii CBS 114405]|uniref:Uncharacterized protein n=1 Tax=Cladophialophora yegresii CBS 114405 TaxID=1182544 RepID=W9W004_9EURO|nr:uncharacterized protein A1O7_05735 [Cladophialophora yegresii CBS 114405]EXJ58310.1 hypothetical protein A1O7_05735 [Cladophialophora yegresii CBS 114405]
MPASNKPACTADSRYPDIGDPKAVAEQDTIPSRAGKRKTKNAAARQLPSVDNADNSTESAPMGQSQLPSSSSNPPPSILGQLPQTFPQTRRSNAFDALNDTNSSQKVSDEHTPPVDLWARNDIHRRTPPVEPIPGLNSGTSPPYEPGFSTRVAFNVRSPPISPPMRNARPVSYGGGNAALPSHHRMSTSPYGYGITAYGSPPALPHLPQQHFYGAHDVDLGVGSPHTPLPEPAPLKFVRLPGSGSDSRDAILLTVDGELHLVSYNGEKLEHIGALVGVQGTIVDATLLPWNTGEDPFPGLRPLVALVVHGSRVSNPGPSPAEDRPFNGTPHDVMETRVVVFSLSKSCEVTELLRVPAASFPGVATCIGRPSSLKVHASGNFIVVFSGESGEIFVFAFRRGKESVVFECLGKYWTTLQPHLQRRDSSSHGPASDADISPADLARGNDAENPPILSLNGRWLALCPAGTSSRRSIGAILGEYVIYGKNSDVNAGTAPARPLSNCEVDSPDVDTFLSKVAKGFAQEAVRGAKWISEKGMQTWQNYWKKETGSPSQPTLQSVSPPAYSPHMALAQFPPTHAGEQYGVPRDPELVSILDLRMLQESQGRKGAEVSSMITFQPPGGCSFLSFTPTGLGLLTANHKGDVQYIWDLMQMKYTHGSPTSTSTESNRVRQIARYERLSPSTIVDVAWDGPTGYRFALLTKNRTIHIFDLPNTCFRWPPPTVKKTRPLSAPVDPAQVKMEHDPPPAGGFLASAMSLAGRTQPMLASLRGRAPSINGGLAGAAPMGIGFASTTSIKSGGRAVAVGLSKSLGAASETVTSIRHANQSRLHLKILARPGMFCWLRREGRSILSILDDSHVKNYYVRMTKPRENRQMETVSVFDARKAVAAKLPKAAEVATGRRQTAITAETEDRSGERPPLLGFWKPRPSRDAGSRTPHPLASAEIETNAPYQPFHSDRRVTISLHTGQASSMVQVQPSIHQRRRSSPESSDRWMFGEDISFSTQSIIKSNLNSADDSATIYRETTIVSSHANLDTAPTQVFDNDIPQVFSSTKKKKGKKNNRAQARLLEEPEDNTVNDVSFDPSEDLLGEEPL